MRENFRCFGHTDQLYVFQLTDSGVVVRCRVMTVSFHKFGDYFFPGTGDVKVRCLTWGSYPQQDCGSDLLLILELLFVVSLMTTVTDWLVYEVLESQILSYLTVLSCTFFDKASVLGFS